MQFNFRNAVVAGAAMFALTACNNSSNDNVFETEESNLKVSIDLPQSSPLTRGIVTDAAGVKDFSHKHTYAYVMKGQKVIDKVQATGKDRKLTASFNSILLDGTEKVLVKVNGEKEDASLAIDVTAIQPTEEAGKLENMIYAGNASLTAAEPVKGVKNYTASMDVNSIAARVEIAGAANFNKELVKSMNVSAVAPMEVIKTYGDKNRTIFEKDKGLWLNVDQAGRDAMAKGSVVANHLFEGDVPSITIGFEIEKYACYQIDNVYQVYVDPTTKEKSFVYILENDKKAINEGTIEAPKLFEVIEGKDANGKTTLTKGEELKNLTNKIKTLPAKTEYFTIKDFEGAKSYEGGKIYLVDLSKNLTWNSEDSGFENAYTPDINTGTETPKVLETANITVTATVKEWTKDNYNTSIN